MLCYVQDSDQKKCVNDSWVTQPCWWGQLQLERKPFSVGVWDKLALPPVIELAPPMIVILQISVNMEARNSPAQQN